MAVLLQSQDRYDDLIELDTASGQITWHSVKNEPHLREGTIDGHFSKLDGKMAALLRENGVLHFRVNQLDVELSDDTEAVWERRPGLHTLTLTRDGKRILRLAYSPPVIDPPLEVDPTPFVEEEHFDFGLFVHNVLQDKGRRERIYCGRPLP